MVELLITSAIMAILVLAVVPVFTVTQRGITSSEAHSSLKNGAQKAVNQVQHDLLESKRIFENTANDTAFLARVQLSGAPAALAGSKLPVMEENGSLSPGTTVFFSTSVGNSLFFASVDTPLDLAVADSLGATSTVRIDRYHFHYYYLAQDTEGGAISDKVKRQLWHWESVPYADHEQLANIADGVKRSSAAAGLYGNNVLYAWNASATSANAAFYDLSSGGNITANAGHNIPKQSAERIMDFKTGLTAGGYRYSVCPNTGGTFNPPHAVPVFGTSSGDFPSGFEIVAVGPNSARQVFVRLVMVAQGSFKGFVSHEQVVLATARDIW